MQTQDGEQSHCGVLYGSCSQRVSSSPLQGGDVGTQYRSGIYTHDEEQAAAAAARIKQLNEKLGVSRAVGCPLWDQPRSGTGT